MLQAKLQRTLFNAPFERIRLEKSAGRISGEFIYLYPPGIPIVTPGEMITGAVIGTIHWWLSDGLHVSGVYEERGVRILC